ncbi:efflux RND transporter periplasmic adaptor subunit [Paraflavitalea sp. CAU 1676]|uniref:efflux RND transporter periplasmic adaptor subunit n=1 Tax=Paraflavitalea sp. CAU 1676 TaxID=3032598 RepID=UPI0023DAD34C|nr:efflux RND transporter periplasmic adaptor subunit [Paraflavitalea sp. CAU 1676]MDF2192922.1 efflux RND transporter periplasmic adaptor subunit [Paraflavitalea sp. CAU 1676]
MKYLQTIKHPIYSALLLLALLSMASCGSNNDAPATTMKEDSAHADDEFEVELTQEQVLTAGITTGQVEQRTLSGTIKVNGTLDVPPQQLVSVSAPMGGFLRSSEMLQGKHVTKGELIATLQDPSYIQLQQDYLEAVSQQEYLKAEYERQQELSAENINARKTVEQAKANYQTMQAKAAGLKAKLRMVNIDPARLSNGDIQSYINIYAPISGYVTEVNVNLGKFVNPIDVMFEIVDTEHLHAELTVFEKDVPLLKLGQKVRFILANETRERMATVYLVGREISTDRTVRVHCHLDIEDKNLLPGMYLTAFVETKNMQLPAVPEQAIVNYEGTDYLFVEMKEGGIDKEGAHHYKAVPVKTGIRELGYAEVVLPNGFDTTTSRIVVKGAYDLLAKLKNKESEGGHGH